MSMTYSDTQFGLTCKYFLLILASALVLVTSKICFAQLITSASRSTRSFEETPVELLTFSGSEVDITFVHKGSLSVLSSPPIINIEA